MAEKKLLIFHQGALGDFVLAFPALIRLKKRFTAVDAVCQPQLGELAKELGLLDNWFSHDTACLASLFSDAIDPVVTDLLNRYDEIILFSFSKDLAHAIEQVRPRPVHRIPPRPEPADQIHVALHLLKKLATYRLLTDVGDSNALEPSPLSKQPEALGNPLDCQKVLLHPGAGSQKKMWPLKNFLQLERLLESDGYTSEYILGPAEGFLKDALQIHTARQKVVHRPANVPALAALLKTSGGYIGNDSGVSHLAAFLGLPTVAVFGPSNPEMWRPIGPRVATVYPRHSKGSSADTHPKTPAPTDSFAGITPAAVLSAFHKI
jgi:ADP-heptose:LPS heptosyltransferase